MGSYVRTHLAGFQQSATAAEASSVDTVVVIVVVVSAIIVVAMIPTAAPPPLDLIVVSLVRGRQHHQPPSPLVMPLLHLLYGWLLCHLLSRQRLPSTGTSASCRAVLAIYSLSPLAVIIPPASATHASRAFGQMLGEGARVRRGAINKAAAIFLLPLPCNV